MPNLANSAWIAGGAAVTELLTMALQSLLCCAGMGATVGVIMAAIFRWADWTEGRGRR